MRIVFDEIGHTYTNGLGAQIPSVTKILGAVYGTGLENAPSYFVERAAEKGHAVHKEIETYLKTRELGNSPEFQTWHKRFKNTVPVMAGESEKVVYATTPYGPFAGTVDLLGNGFMYDWKTCKTATRKQVEKWQKQLSFYCYALRQMRQLVNEPLKIVHVNGSDLEIINVDYLGDDFVEETMRLYAEGKQAEKPSYELQTVSQTDLQILEDTIFQIETLEKVVDNIREKIRVEMETRGILDLQIGKVKMTYVAGGVRKGLDSKKLKEEQPALFASYLKETQYKPSLRITVNGK